MLVDAIRDLGPSGLYSIAGREDLVLNVTSPIGMAQGAIVFLVLVIGLYVAGRMIENAWRRARPAARANRADVTPAG